MNKFWQNNIACNWTLTALISYTRVFNNLYKINVHWLSEIFSNEFGTWLIICEIKIFSLPRIFANFDNKCCKFNAVAKRLPASGVTYLTTETVKSHIPNWVTQVACMGRYIASFTVTQLHRIAGNEQHLILFPRPQSLHTSLYHHCPGLTISYMKKKFCSQIRTIAIHRYYQE